jgi:hypothetical protein
VQVTAFTTGGDRRTAPLNCPAAAVRSGIITVPAKPQKLVCTFNITGLSSYNGAVLPLVYTGGANSSPIAANSGPFDMELKDAVVLGDCAYLGGSWSLTNAAGSTKGVPQPTMDADDRPKGFACQSGQGAIGLTFGPFSNTQCGTYQVRNHLSLTIQLHTPCYGSPPHCLRMQYARECTCDQRTTTVHVHLG